MRVLVVRPGPAFSVEDVARGWSKALNALGTHVYEFALGERLDFYVNARLKKGRRWVSGFDWETARRIALEGVEAVCYRFWPDVVLVVSGLYMPPNVMGTLRERHTVVLLCTESPYEDDRQLEQAEHADLVLLNDPTNIDKFSAITKTLYVPHAYDSDVHYPGTGPRDLDFAFVGTGFPSRIEFFEAVDWSGLSVELAGHWKQLADDSPLLPFVMHPLGHCLDNKDTADVYRSARSSVNFYRKEANRPDLVDGWAMGPREVELAACGTFFLTQERGENREVLPMVPTFDGAEDFGQQLRWWLAHDREREAVVAAARQAIAPRTFEANARLLLNHLPGRKPTS